MSANPFVDRGPFRNLIIGGYLLPGVIETIDDVDPEEEWAVQPGIGTTFATCVWRRSKLAENIKVTLKLLSQDDYDGYVTARDTLRPKRGKKPPSFGVKNPIFEFNGINRVTVRVVGAPRWQEAKGYWTGTIHLLEYNPPRTTTIGVADPAKPPDEPTPNDKAEREISDLKDAIQREASYNPDAPPAGVGALNSAPSW